MATTVYYLSPISLIVQYLNNQGGVAAGGKLYTYLAGTVSTLAQTFTDATGLVQNPNPLTLNSAGRPVSQSGAPIEFWAPASIALKLVVQDSAGNQLVYLDNLAGLNDLTNQSNSLAVQLGTPTSSNASGVGPVAGADLVANAVKSYDVFASVRAANAPAPLTGQTVNIEVQGGTAAGDGLGGLFYWSPTSTATDDGRTVLKPNSIVSGSGRWLRYYPLGVPQVIVKSADQTIANTVALVSDTQLLLNNLPPGIYLVSLRLLLAGAGGTTQGYKIQLTSTLSLTITTDGTGVYSGNAAATAYVFQQNTSVAVAAINSTGADGFNGDIILNSTGSGANGNLTVQFTQNSSSANTVTMKAGSALIVTRIG